MWKRLPTLGPAGDGKTRFQVRVWTRNATIHYMKNCYM